MYKRKKKKKKRHNNSSLTCVRSYFKEIKEENYEVNPALVYLCWKLRVRLH